MAAVYVISVMCNLIGTLSKISQQGLTAHTDNAVDRSGLGGQPTRGDLAGLVEQLRRKCHEVYSY